MHLSIVYFQTFTTFEMVKKDLNEFTDVVASEACSLASTTIKIVRQQAYNFQQFMSLEEENDKRHKEASQKIERKPDKVSYSNEIFINTTDWS